MGHCDVRIAAPERIVHLIRDLDEYLGRLYPSECNHLMDVDALQKPHVRVFVATVPDGEAVGCCALCHHGDYGELKRMYVQPTHRRSGIGGALLRRVEQEARASGLSKLRLETGISQPEAIRLYAYHGFVRCGAFGSYPDDPMSIFMEKDLTGG